MAKEKQTEEAQTEEAQTEETAPEPTVEEVQASIEIGETAVNVARNALISVDTTDPKALREASVTLSKAVTALNKDRRTLKKLQGTGGSGAFQKKNFIREMLTTGPQTNADVEAAVTEKFGPDSYKEAWLKSIVRDLRKAGTLVEVTTYYTANVPVTEPD